MTAGGFPNAGSHPFYISAYTLGQRDLGQIFGCAGPTSGPGGFGALAAGRAGLGLARGPPVVRARLGGRAGWAQLGARARRCAGAGRYGLGVEFAG